jgi:hypothetical protein
MTDFAEYEKLAGKGIAFGSAPEALPPEQEFFHSLYISGKTRANHIGVQEKAGEFQIRGVEYNLKEVNMVIVHVKDILVKEGKPKPDRKQNIECFSYKEGASPWYGSTKLENGSPRPCPNTSAERAVVEFCAPCRSQIVVAGIYCTPEGNPVLNEEKKPIFIFLRAKGVKYKNISDYLSSLYNEDLSPIFTPQTDASKKFEKEVVNHKRFITKITKGSATTGYGDKDVFVLTKAAELPTDAVKKILEFAKSTIDKFDDKFNWSKVKTASSYAKPAGVLEMTAPSGTTSPKTEEKKEEPKKQGSFSFDDVEF